MKLRVIITGTTCSGKTTTLNLLKNEFKGKEYRFIDEVAAKYIREQQSANKNPFENMVNFELTIMKLNIEAENAISTDEVCVISDRSVLDTLAISDMCGIKDVIGPIAQTVRTRTYDLVFILDRLSFQKTMVRRENEEEAIKQDKFIRKTYDDFRSICGYKIISIPVKPEKERVALIASEIRKLQKKRQLIATLLTEQ